jgi:hypothetical protein
VPFEKLADCRTFLCRIFLILRQAELVNLKYFFVHFCCLVFFGFSRRAESGSVPFEKMAECRTCFCAVFF